MDHFQSFIDVTTMPVNGEIYARISDNVLDDEDYNVSKLTIHNSMVIAVQTVHGGCYPLGSDLIGMTTLQLAKWSEMDYTGSHPENFHELAHPHNL
jgi:sporulation protein YlmC with PRC-barrel domain